MNFPDALERGLTGTGSSARRGLETILGWTAGRADADPWTGSLLTMPGFPVEFAFSSGDRGVRYCAEVEDPRRCPQGRLEAAEALLRQCNDVARPDESVMTEFRSLQSQGALGYGCWIGGRATAVERNRFKLYVEIPEAASEAATAWEESLCGSRLPSFPGQTFPVTMAGYDLASGRMEFYHRALDAPSTVVALLLRRIGLEHRAPEILDVLQKAYRFRLGGRLPSRDVGFS
jgi:hypothetical protein